MERRIGEVFGYNGEWYQCVKDSSNNCVNCCFYNGGHKECDDELGECSKGCRSDETSVIFKKLRKAGEPFLYKEKQMQSYIRATDELICNWNNNLLLLEHGDSDIIDIEIKQTKEDMGDNADIRPYNELFSSGTVSNTKHLTKEDMEEKKLNLKPFNIQKAKEGKPVCTRDGRKARILCFDRLCCDEISTIVACVLSKDGKDENVIIYNSDGFMADKQHPYADDLMMIPEKKEGWINVYTLNTCYYSKEEAEANIDQDYKGEYIRTVKINWEE